MSCVGLPLVDAPGVPGGTAYFNPAAVSVVVGDPQDETTSRVLFIGNLGQSLRVDLPAAAVAGLLWPPQTPAVAW